MKCLFVDGVKEVSLKERDVLEVGKNDVLVKLEARGICGTDLNSYRSGYAMGFGHEMSGYVYKVGANSTFKEGTKVFVSNLSQNLVNYDQANGYAYMGGFADYILVKNAKENVDLYPVDDHMTYSETALVEPFCVGMSGVKKYPFTKDSKVVILGAGIIGMCAFEYLRSQGVHHIVVADINENRLERAKNAGAYALNTSNTNIKDYLTEVFSSAYSMIAGIVPDVDVYIDAAGVASLTNEVLGMIKMGGQITILAAYHNLAPLNLSSVMYNSARIVGSCMFDHEDILEAIDIIGNNKEIAKTLISHEISFENAKEGFAIADDTSQSLKVMLVG